MLLYLIFKINHLFINLFSYFQVTYSEQSDQAFNSANDQVYDEYEYDDDFFEESSDDDGLYKGDSYRYDTKSSSNSSNKTPSGNKLDLHWFCKKHGF